MKYEVDGWNNFCRVFELPSKFSSEFCFRGGHPTNFQMVDWFNPVPEMQQPAVSKEVWREKVGEIEVKEIDMDILSSKMTAWLRNKLYVKEGKKYLVICDFGGTFIFSK